ncbi:MAG: tetratricopeptide repeat protein, partial [Ignavibacteriae bacterium]
MSRRTVDELVAVAIEAASKKDAATLDQCALDLEEIGTQEALANAALTRGWTERLRGNSRVSIDHYQRALVLFSEVGDGHRIAHINANISLVEYSAGNYQSALEYGHRSLEQHTSIGDRRGMAKNYLDLGIVFYSTGDNPSALEHFRRALALYEELGDALEMARVIGNIGNIYDALGDYPQALQHFERAIAIQQEKGDLYSVALVTSNIGMVYHNLCNYESSLEYFRRALALREELGDQRGIANTLGNIGLPLAGMARYPEALEHYHRALALHKKLGESERVTRVTGDIIHALLGSGAVDEAENWLTEFEVAHINHPDVVIKRTTARARILEHREQLDEAMVTFRSALTLARDHAFPKSQVIVHRYLRELCLKRNDLAGYVEHSNEYNRITEEIRGKEVTQKLTMMEAERKMEMERSEHQKHLAVLHSTLPKHIADRVARGETVNDHYENASVIFLDIVGFTTISEQLSSDQVVQLLEQIFTTLDAVCEKHDVVKIKTIGDSYMAVAFPHSVRNDSPLASHVGEEGGIPSDARDEVCRAANAALDMLHAVSHIVSPTGSPDGSPESSPESSPLQVRIGLHSGPVTAGVIGTTRMQYDVWGDTVNVASRMESTSEPGRIHVSSSFALALNSERAKKQNSEMAVIPSVSEEPGTWHLELRGETELKGKGTMTTYWLESA